MDASITFQFLKPKVRDPWGIVEDKGVWQIQSQLSNLALLCVKVGASCKKLEKHYLRF